MTTIEGLNSAPLRQAVATALAGKSAALEMLLGRHGGGADRRPNLRLAAALGAELVASPGPAAQLLARFAANDAAPDTPEVFLPIAAAYGWAARAGAGVEPDEAWAALAVLAADERAPVRLATREALLAFAARARAARSQRSSADELITRATIWLDDYDRDTRFGAAAIVAEVLADRRVLAGAADTDALLAYLSRAIAEIAEAPRAAERSDSRRRLLLSLPGALAAVAAILHAGDRGSDWLEAECAGARHPDVRGALSDAILALRSTGQGSGGAAPSQRLREALEGSAKPPRDPTRKRPGTGRGKSSRPVR